jgi:hypothetical protein
MSFSGAGEVPISACSILLGHNLVIVTHCYFFKLACLFPGAGEVPISTKIILSSHHYKETPPAAELHARAACVFCNKVIPVIFDVIFRCWRGAHQHKDHPVQPQLQKMPPAAELHLLAACVVSNNVIPVIFDVIQVLGRCPSARRSSCPATTARRRRQQLSCT